MSQKPDITFLGDCPEFTEFERALALCEQSWCDFAYFLRTKNRFRCDSAGVATSMRHKSLAQVKETFDIFKKMIEDGDPSAMVSALDYACEEGLPLPYWLSDEVRTRIAKTFKNETTLHEAFGLSEILPESGKKAGIARRRLKESYLLWTETSTLMNEQKSMSLHAALCVVHKRNNFSFGLTVAKRLFNERDHNQRLHLGKKDEHR